MEDAQCSKSSVVRYVFGINVLIKAFAAEWLASLCRSAKKETENKDGLIH